MGKLKREEILVTNLKKISVPGGDIFHALKKSDLGFKEFGEAYFSSIKTNEIKAWKRHKRMTLNLIVPVGKVKFVFTRDKKHFDHYIIGEENYCRLTVPPWVWFGFQSNFNSTSLILNIADIIHDNSEVQKKDISLLDYNWEN